MNLVATVREKIPGAMSRETDGSDIPDRHAEPTTWAQRLTLGVSAVALIAANSALLWQEGLSRPLALSALISVACLGLGYALVRSNERKAEAQGQAADNQQRFDMAFAGARCGIWDWDIAENRVYWSKAMFDMLGRRQPATRMTPSEIKTLTHPDDVNAIDEIIAAPEKASRSYDTSFRLLHEDGSWIWVHGKSVV